MLKYTLAIVVVLVLFGCEDKESRLQSFLIKGNEELNKGDNEKALYYYTEALKLDSCYAPAWNNTAVVHDKAHRYKEAIESYSSALNCSPGLYLPRLHRADVYYESGEFYNSLKDVDQLIKQWPDSAKPYFLQGLLYDKLGEYESSISAYQKAIDHRHPDSLECRINIANEKLALKRFEEAKSDLESCLKLDDKQPFIYNSLALIAIEEKDFNQAIRQANKGLDLAPREAYILNNRGFAYLELGDLEKAAADINESIVLDPYNSWAYRNKGVLELKKKNFPEAERLLKKAKEMNPKTERVDEYLAMIPKTGR